MKLINWHNECYKRAIKVAKRIGIMIGIGFCYGLWCKLGGFTIPCLFYQITGKYCPGCGMTRMGLSLMQLDLRSAFHNNSAVFILLPLGLVIGIRWMERYIRYGKRGFTRGEEIAFVFMIIVLIVFGILRNIDAFSFLRPL